MDLSTSPRADDHLGVLRSAHDEGAARHPSVRLPFDVFARRALALSVRRLQRSFPSPSRDDVAAVLQRAALADVYLAAACEEGVPGAWDRFVETYEPAIVGLAIRRGASRGEADEIARELPGELFSPPQDGGARTRLGTFDGAGSLLGWLAVIVQRRIADRLRSASRAPAAPSLHPDREPGATRAGTPADDPVARAVGAESGRRFGAALREAWTELTPREELVLLLRFRDDLPQTEIARLLGVGEPRVSRMLASGAERLRSAVLRRMGRELGGDDRNPGPTWTAIEHAVAQFLATLPRAPDSSPKS